MSGHTLGPWTLLGTDATMHREVESSDHVLIMAETEYGSETPTNHADWLLIAAAPELLKAAKEALDILDGPPAWSAESELLRSAIAKAEGRT